MLRTLESSSQDEQQVLACSALELFMQEHEYNLAFKLMAEYPDLRKCEYVTSTRFADDLFASAKLGDIQVLRGAFEKLGLPVHIQDRSEFNLLEYGVSEQVNEVVQYAHQVLALTSDKADSLFSYMAWEGNKTLLRYLKNEVGLVVSEGNKVVESCARSKEIDMVQFASEELGITAISSLETLEPAIQRAAEIGQLKPLQDLIDRFSINIDPVQLRRKYRGIEVRDEAVALYFREVLKVAVTEA